MNGTKYLVICADGRELKGKIDWPESPSFIQIAALVEPLLDNADLEQISVVHEGKRVDMFVDDRGRLKGLPLNHKATSIYRYAALNNNPSLDPDKMPCIVGNAVLFNRRIWF